MTQRSYNDSPQTPTVTYTYDNVTNAKGKLTKVANSNSETYYTAFDVLGRVTAHKQALNGWEFPTYYTYNLAGMLLEETYPSARVVKNTIGANSNLSQVETKPSAGSFSTRANNFVYNAPGSVQSMQLGNSKYETTAFNARLQPTQIGLGTSTTDTSLLKIEYGYGTSTANNGNVTTQKITVPGVTYAFEQAYTYDSLNRIASVVENYNNSQLWTQVYGYDRYGNRNITSGTGTTSLTFGSTNNRITTSGYSYDSNGNTIAEPSGGGKSFTYDAENKQRTVTSGSTLGEYWYDGDGKRVKKDAANGDDRIFLYDAFGKLVEERDLSNNLQTSYVYAGSRLLSTETSSGTNYLTADHLGSPRINTDGSGNVVARHDYMPFGEEIFTALTAQRTSGVGYTGGDGIRKQFTGYERDTETGLDYAQARYFGSGLGRFSSPDSIFNDADGSNPQRWNLYAYVINNPTRFIDPTGERIWIHYNVEIEYEEDGESFTRIEQRRVEYTGAGLRNQDGSEYTGNDAYVVSAAAAIKGMMNDSYLGRSIMNLISTKEDFNIMRDPKDANRNGVDPTIFGRGTNIYWSGKEASYWQNMGEETPSGRASPQSSLGHELVGHAWTQFRGMERKGLETVGNCERGCGQILRSEIDAVNIENRVNAMEGTDSRTTYGGWDIGEFFPRSTAKPRLKLTPSRPRPPR